LKDVALDGIGGNGTAKAEGEVPPGKVRIMWKAQRILVALDGSAEDARALETARDVTEREAGELVLAMVIPSFRTVPSHDCVSLTDFANATGQAQEYLNELASKLTGLRVHTLVRVSPLSAAEMGAELMHLAAEEHSDLMVMTAKSQFARKWFGSLEHKVPLLLIPTESERPLQGHRVLAPRLRPALRLSPALGSLFFFAGPQGTVFLCRTDDQRRPDQM
jgi:nucleotide-binding universal stress UspA family protein